VAKKQIASQLRALRQLERRRRAVVQRLLDTSPLLRGTLSRILQRCGKPNCHCAKKPAHPVWRLASSREGHQRCQLVRQGDVEWAQEHVGRYKDLRAALRTLEAIHKEERAGLRGLLELRAIEYE
jgi:hypothetical protein